MRAAFAGWQRLHATWRRLKNHQTGVQWKQGEVIYLMLYTSLLYYIILHPSTAPPSHCSPL